MVFFTIWRNQSIGKKIIIFTVLAALFALVIVGLYFAIKELQFDQNHDKKAIINIHFVPHTHDDVGWLKTVDQYYYGRNQSIQRACVQCIIDNVIRALERDPNRKFIYVETAFLWKWWQERNESQRKVLKKLVDEGRLEIIGGGWSMNDEAVTYYQSIIDQFTWGFRRINDMFGSNVRPRIGWQIDPFGHSREQASIFAQMGFDGLFFARFDHEDKAKRLRDKAAELIWRGSPSLGESSNLFTSVLFNHYSPPPGFCFDILCRGTEHVNEENIERRVSSLLSFVLKQSKSYRTNNVLLTMGDDFHYANAETWFQNMDKLIKYINENKVSKFKAFYSTPSYYVDYVNELNLTWSEKTDDFFPYSSNSHAYWTGYYSSRPTLKFFERLGNNFLQVLKQISVISNQSDSEELKLFREAMGVMQHHDAITGTERQHVAEDYEKILYESFENGEKVAERALNKLTRKNSASQHVRFHSCFLLNISSCEHSSDYDKFVVTVYNPTSQPLTTNVRLPINKMPYIVRDFSGQELVTQIVPTPSEVIEVPGRRRDAGRELIFEAKDIPGLGYQSFYVSVNGREFYDLNMAYSNMNGEKTIGGELYNISIKADCAVSVQSKNPHEKLNFEQSFRYYEGHQYGTNTHSGAYVFRPQANVSKDLSGNCTYKILKGALVEEIHLKINDWISQVVRFYKNKEHVEFDWLVGPILTSDGIGKEVITKFSSNLKNEGEFYTDSNGRDMMKRKLNYRPTWDLKLEEPVSGNYYPVTTKISIEDKNKNSRLSVLTDRAQGGSSLLDGEIELMVHRRLLRDDGFGVGEALIEDAYYTGLVVRGQHYVVSGNLTNKDEVILREKKLAMELATRPWLFITPTEKSFDEWNDSYKMKSDEMVRQLSKNVRVLTLEPWKDGEVLLRLEHAFEKDETTKYSVPVQIDLKNLFAGFDVQSVKETILGGNQLLKGVQRLKWSTNENKNLENNLRDTVDDRMIVTLNPMEIKTFIVKLS